ncbi:hypothetical protein AB4Y63_03440 [Leifsonia sp. YAF41]|uniref:hypothetical protein n=1 Tax=Leifsonia sp. YAF41 TaxID=3233086 RepID=UPI003F965BDF
MFTTHEAALRGIREGRLRGGDLGRPFHGIRVSAPARSVSDRARAYQRRMPDAGFFCSITAAQILRIPVPIRLDARSELHVGMPSPQRAPRSSGTAGHKLQIGVDDLCDCSGLRVTTAARTWCDLATVLDLEDLVAAGDHIVHHRHPLCSITDLREAAARHPGRRGRARLIEALDLLVDNADSPPESIVRVTVIKAGIRGLVPNYPIADARGIIFARADLCFPAHRVIFEYQGDYHRTEILRWRKDRTRLARLAAAGWHVIEIAADELTDRRMLLQLIRDSLKLFPALHTL